MIPIWIRLLGSKVMTKESYAICAGKRVVFVIIFFSFISKLFQKYFQKRFEFILIFFIKTMQYNKSNASA